MDFPIDLTNVVINTERLTLRAFKPSDLEDFFEYAKVPGVGEMAGWSHHKDINESQMILDMFMNGKKTFAIVYDGKVIGSLGIEETNPNHFPELNEYKCKELGYVLAKPFWGRGFMPELAKAAIEYLFKEQEVDCITCCSFISNPQSERVQHKVGFQDCKSFTFETRMGTEEPSIGRVIWNNRVPLSERVYTFLRMIPDGKVATYGQIAEYLGDKRLARVVGNILHVNPDPDKNPCFKVVNAKGELAKHFGAPGGIDEQKRRLENDGVVVKDYKVDLSKYQYRYL